MVNKYLLRLFVVLIAIFIFIVPAFILPTFSFPLEMWYLNPCVDTYFFIIFPILFATGGTLLLQKFTKEKTNLNLLFFCPTCALIFGILFVLLTDAGGYQFGPIFPIIFFTFIDSLVGVGLLVVLFIWQKLATRFSDK